MPSLMDILNSIDAEKTISFPLRLSGSCSCATKGALAKISMAVPPEIVNNSLHQLDDWQLVIIAIKKGEYDRVILELKR